MRFFFSCMTVVTMVGFFAASSVHAATPCDCFCGTDAKGAYAVANDVSNDTCITTCKNADAEVIGCFTEREQWPDRSELCWTQTECQSNGSEYEWMDSVAECSDDPLAMGFCYKPPVAVSLLQSFGGHTAFSGVPRYVSAVYEYLIPIGALLAVVFLMISGLQYILARGNPDGIKKAKARIVGAVTGLVLLMSAWTLANVLDPRLVHLRQLRIPMLKEVVLLNAESTCEYLSSVGYGIDGKYAPDVKGDCGTTGKVTDVERVPANVITGSWSSGDECKYKGCSAGYACTNNECLSCYVASYNLGYASESTCALFTSATTDTTDNETVCEYIPTAADSPTCGLGTVDCKDLRSDGGGCRDYDEVILQSLPGMSGASAYNERMDVSVSAERFSEFCSSDPCDLGGVAGCMVHPSTDGFDCVGGFDIILLDASGGIGAGGTCFNNKGETYNCQTGS